MVAPKRLLFPSLAILLLSGILPSAPVCAADYSRYLAKPVKNGLELWVKADDIKGIKDGDRVSVWQDSSGLGHDLRADGDGRPYYQADGLAGHPAVVFKGDNRANPKVNNFFDLPLKGEWRGVTVFAVGKGLSGPGWFDTAPGSNGCLRTMGWLQLTGDKIAAGSPFTNLSKIQGVEIACMTCGFDDQGAMQFASYGNGDPQAQAADPDAFWGIVFQNAHIGNNNGGESVFNGEIAELLVYRGDLSDKNRKAVERYLEVKYGLSVKQPADPGIPEGYTPPTPPEELPPPPAVKAKPFTGDLKMWARADDVVGLKDGDLLSSWPNAQGGDPLISEAPHQPIWVARGINNRPAIRFQGNSSANPKIANWVTMPLKGQWSEMTLIVAGRKLNSAGVFDTAPGTSGCFRTFGWMQLTGSKLDMGDPLPLLRNDRDVQIMAVKFGKLGADGQAVTTYANGHQQMHSEVATGFVPILFQGGEIGTNNLGESQFNGDVAEVLVYDRALTDAEMQQTRDYLVEKYGVTIKSDAQIDREAKAHSSWTFKLPHLNNSLSWFGNSFSGDKAWVQSGMSDIAVLPDGTVAGTCVWDEPHKEIGFYKDGKCVGPVVHGGGITIIRNGDTLISGLSGMGKPQTGFKRLSLDGNEMPWPGFAAGQWPMFDVPDKWLDVKGMAVVGNSLYVASLGRDDIQVFDLDTAKLQRSFPLTKPGRMVADKNSKLWIGVPEGAAQVDTDGKPTGKKIEGVTVGALAFDPQGRLAIADAGDRQQIIFYDVTGDQPKEVATLGQRGGVWAGPVPGAMGPDRLIDPNGLGFDDAGNVYVNGSGLLRSYTPDGKLRWQLECTVFCTCSDFDPSSDGADIYTAKHHFRYVPGQAAGKDWKWIGWTDDLRKWPQTYGPGGQNQLIRRLDGHLVRYVLGEQIAIQRKDPNGELFIPCGVYYPDEHRNGARLPGAPEKGRYFWVDQNGNGLADAGEFSVPKPDAPSTQPCFNRYVDLKGGIWEAQDRWGVRCTPLKGMTPGGAPIYDLADQVVYPRPAQFIDVQRAVYIPETDTMYLSGDTWDHPALGTEWWGNCGREVIRYDNWTKPDRKIRSRMPFPEGADNIRAISVAAGSNLLFAGQMDTSVIFIYDTTDGKLLGMVEPDDQLFGGVGWIDIDLGVRAFEQKNGGVILLVEDSFAQKQMVYHVPPRGQWLVAGG